MHLLLLQLKVRLLLHRSLRPLYPRRLLRRLSLRQMFRRLVRLRVRLLLHLSLRLLHRRRRLP